MLSNVDLVMESPFATDNEDDDDNDDAADDNNLKNKGGKKRRCGSRWKRGFEVLSDDEADVGTIQEGCHLAGTATTTNNNINSSIIDSSLLPLAPTGSSTLLEGNEEDDTTMYGKNKGAPSNATWVQCDRCKKWRRLRGVVDAKKLNLPTKWYCSMNKNDPERSKCTAPEEEYHSALNTAPETFPMQRSP
jgi:hypothetical protein